MNVTKVNILFFLLLITTPIFSQLDSDERNNTVADCQNAIEMIHFKKASVQFSGSYGFLDELSELGSNRIEQNSVWLKLNPQVSGELKIDFQPVDNFGFEYFIFIDSLGDFCTNDYESIKSESLIEQGEYLTGDNITSKPISPVNLKLTKNANVSYYLLLHSNEIHQKTLIINFTLNSEDNELIYVQNLKKNKRLRSVEVKLRDKYSKTPVIGNLTISGIKIDNSLFMGSDFIFDAYNSRNSELSINAEGYFIHASTHRISALNDSELIIELEPLAIGKKLELEGINFKLNSKDFLPISYIALKRLLDFMILNSSIKIEIHGHVNSPGNKNSVKAKKLSESRAKNAYSYLVENGIDKKRITYIGKGATEMINPKPKNNEEEEANRRVEFIIIE